MGIAESNVHASQQGMIDSANANWFAGPMLHTPGNKVAPKCGLRLPNNRQLVSLVRHEKIRQSLITQSRSNS